MLAVFTLNFRQKRVRNAARAVRNAPRKGLERCLKGREPFEGSGMLPGQVRAVDLDLKTKQSKKQNVLEYKEEVAEHSKCQYL